jgi:hypothetical protein
VITRLVSPGVADFRRKLPLCLGLDLLLDGLDKSREAA